MGRRLGVKGSCSQSCYCRTIRHGSWAELSSSLSGNLGEGSLGWTVMHMDSARTSYPHLKMWETNKFRYRLFHVNHKNAVSRDIFKGTCRWQLISNAFYAGYRRARHKYRKRMTSQSILEKTGCRRTGNQLPRPLDVVVMAICPPPFFEHHKILKGLKAQVPHFIT